MPSGFVLLQCIGKAAVKNIVNLVSFGVGGDLLVDVWDNWRRATREEQRAAEVQAVAQLTPAELRAEVARIVREEAASLPPAQQAQVASYLTQVPASIHRSLRRSSDPTGTTLATGAVFHAPEDLRPLLPASIPRFKVGDRPLPGVDWELVELLGVGGFGEVWKARNPHFDGVAPVALKFCQDERARDRLLKHEAAVLNQVMRQGKHEGIVPLLHTYLSADPPCLAYEYIDGGDLARLIQQRRGGLPPQQAAQVIHRLAEIVGFAHRLSPPIVHRDLKPANILVKSRPGSKFALRITDFGIGGLAIQEAMEQSSRGTSSGEFLASAVRGAYTPLYASPQQMRGDDPDPRDDVYALGVIWYQLLIGDLTKGRPGGEAWRKLPADLGMTPALLALLASTYEDKRSDRPASAMDLAEKLDQVLHQEGQERQRQEQDEEARRMQEATEREEQQRAEKQHRREERERQERELERHQDENLRRWRDSGQAQEWVEGRRGEWDQTEWRKLVETLKQTDLWPLKLEAVRTLLEELKRDCQTRMEVKQRESQEGARRECQVWHYTLYGQQASAPISAAQLKQLAVGGDLKPTDLIWRDSMTDWVPASSIEGIFTSGKPEWLRMMDEGRLRPLGEPENDARHSVKGRRFLSRRYLLLGGGVSVVLIWMGLWFISHFSRPKPIAQGPSEENLLIGDSQPNPVAERPIEESIVIREPPPKPVASQHDGPQGAVPAESVRNSPPKPVAQRPLEDIITNSIGLKLVLVKPGSFLMGSPENEAERHTNEDLHEVEITRPFYVGVYEVTQEQYNRVMGKNPSFFSSKEGMDTHQFPVERVSWWNAVEFCRRLSELSEEKGKERAYRLPTEAEWEYVCQGGPFFQEALLAVLFRQLFVLHASQL